MYPQVIEHGLQRAEKARWFLESDSDGVSAEQDKPRLKCRRVNNAIGQSMRED